jgi:DNA-binding transcriptional ArsR family regulator
VKYIKMVTGVLMMEKSPTNPVPQPDETFTITSLETLNIVSDELRAKILETLSTEPLTVKEVAARLDLDPKKLYYHFRMLEEHGLIRVTSTQIISGIIEKHYQTRAHYFLVDASLLAFGEQTPGRNVDIGLSYVFDKAKEAIRQGLASGVVEAARNAPITRRLLARRESLFLTSAQVQYFYTQLEALAKEMEMSQAEGTESDCQWYDMVISLYPVQMAQK